MVRPARDAIQSYMSITGASESLAIQSLEEHGNNLSEAITSHFRDVERSILGSDFETRSEYNVVEDNYPRQEYNQVRGKETRPVPGGLPTLLAAARAFRPSLLLDPNYIRNFRRQLSGGLGSGNSGNPSPSTHTGREVTGFPAPPGFGEVRDSYAPHSSSTWRNDQIPPPPPSGFGEVRDGYARPSPSYGSQVNSNDAEEEMIRAAIEASKKDFEDRRHYDPASVLSRNEVINREDEEIARAISMSLELEEQESAFREQLAEFMPQSMEHRDPFQSNINESSRYKPTSSSVQYKRKDMKQKQPIGSSSQHGHGHQNVEASYPEKWGAIPSKELDEKLLQLLGTPKKEPLPLEPPIENEDTITLVVKMPDSSRHGRRFLKSYKLKSLFDLIDATGLVKPGTYRLVRSYPRRAFSLQEGDLTFEELGLTNKQEALFLELLV